MSTYVIGDLQGCFAQLEALLAKVGYRRAVDRLWFTGDLINRGPESLTTVRFVKSLGDSAVTVLGNHDLHFLAIVFGGHRTLASDTLDDLMDAPDRLEIAHWLRGLPLMHRENGFAMVHAGLPHIWTLRQAETHAREVESVMRDDERYENFFRHMYGNVPNVWSDALEGMDRHRIITNYFTRMRLMSHAGEMDFSHKGGLEGAPAGFRPWFAYPSRIREPILFGHWAALDGETGNRGMIGLDTGCVWGRHLTAYCLEDGSITRLGCAELAA